MNDKQKILGNLGLENDKELLYLLDLSNRLNKIQHFYPEFQLYTDKSIETSWISNYCFRIVGFNNGEINGATSFKRGWETLLKPTIKKPNNKLGKLTKNPQYFPNGNIPKGDGDEWYFHRGHILARQFHKYVLEYKILNNRYEYTQENWSQSSIDSEYKNLFTQFSIANKAQAKVEEKVHQILREGKTIYYEVKLVFKNKNDQYPIGTEIFFVPLSSPDEFEHYFIPNTDLDFDLSTLHEDDRELSYSDFYKKAYNERYKKYFKNSDRDEREIAENIGSNDFYLDINQKYICPAKNEVETILQNLGNTSNEIFSREKIKDIEKYLLNNVGIQKSKKNRYIVYPVKEDEKIYIGWNVAEKCQSGERGFAPGQKTLEDAFKYMNWL